MAGSMSMGSSNLTLYKLLDETEVSRTGISFNGITECISLDLKNET